MNIRRCVARPASSSLGPLVCRRILAILWVVACLVVSAGALLAAGEGDVLAFYCQRASPATFRDPAQFSRYERALAVAMCYEDVRSLPVSLRREMGAETLAREARAYQVEVALLGVDLAELQRPPETWPQVVGRSVEPESWGLEQDAVEAAFWTDPSSPILRLVASMQRVTAPGIGGTHGVTRMALDSWSPPWQQSGFLEEPLAPSRLFAELPPRQGTQGPVLLLQTQMEKPLGARMDGGLSLAAVRAHPPMASLRNIIVPRLDAAGRTSRWLEGMVPAPTLAAGGPSLQWAATGLLPVERLGIPSVPQAARFVAGDWQRTGVTPLAASRMLSPTLGALRGVGLEWRASSRVGLALRLDELANLRAMGAPPTSGPLRLQGAGVNLDYSVTENLRLQGGYIYQRTRGLQMPSLSTGTAGTLSLADERAYPYVGFDYRFNEDARWKFNVRFSPGLDGTNSLGTLPNLGDPTVTTELRLRF